MGMEMAMKMNRSTSRIGVPQWAADTYGDGNFMRGRRNSRWDVQRKNFLGAQERAREIEGKTCERAITAALKASKFERIDLWRVDSRNGGHRGAIARA